jgi:ABC-type antimicrobial peptide transport system permease subunit
MTLSRLAFDSLRYYWRTHAAVAAGVAAAVAVLAGALLVGHSVRESLRSIASGRLGRTQLVVSADHPFTTSLADRVTSRLVAAKVGPQPQAVPLFALTGSALHEPSGRRANVVNVYGVDQRFFTFHGVTATAPTGTDAWLSADLAAELTATGNDALVVRVARPTDIPVDSLHGRRDDTGKSLRLTVRGVLAREAMGEFSLAPTQGPVRAVFMSLARLERDLAQPDRANVLLTSGLPSGETGVKTLRDALGPSLTADDLGLRFETLDRSTFLAEATGGLVSDAMASAIEAAAGRESLSATPVFTWLANRMTVGSRTTPYSLVTAIGPDAAGDKALADALKGPQPPQGSQPPPGPQAQQAPPPIVLNEWLARDLGAKPGDALTLEYYRWAEEGRLVTDQASFKVAGVLPMRGLAVDRRLAPPYPGITEARGFSEWDPPFPIDLKLVRPADETYWKEYRTSPKAFMPLASGQRLWGTRYGRLTSVRLRPTKGDLDLPAITTRLAGTVPASVPPASAGLTTTDVETQNAAASAGATDFGAYFSYFSFFLMVSALLLAALCFRLSIEQRLQHIGVLRATGYPLETIRKLWFIEGGIVAAIGAVIGMALAVAWAAFMMHGLATWWIGAVGTTRLQLHVTWTALAIGALAGALAAAAAIALTVRRLSVHTPRQLISGSTEPPLAELRSGWPVLALMTLAAAIVLSLLTAMGVIPAAGGFFGAGLLVLVGGILALSRWLRRSGNGTIASVTDSGLMRLGVRNASWRPGRSLTSAGLVASAVFLIVSVDAFRKGADTASGRQSGTGGFALMAESALPIVDDPSTTSGMESLGLQGGPNDAAMAGVKLVPMRLRPGDDASCLNLYQPAQPRVLGVSQAFIDERRFAFARSTATNDEDKANPWRLLGPADPEGAVPAILDATSLEYIFHAAVGDVITIDAATPRPVKLRVVGALADSVLQGEILISERAFLSLYPRLAGYRVLLVDITPATAERTATVTKLLEDRLNAFGVDAQETSARLAAFHRVENTYLSTFQTLGGLGLVLGTLGLIAVIARNVLERRRELALLGAAGYSGRDLQLVVSAEYLVLVAAGLAIGALAAAVAIAPVLAQRGLRPPLLPLTWLAIVAGVGVLTALIATIRVRRLPLVASLRSE